MERHSYWRRAEGFPHRDAGRRTIDATTKRPHEQPPKQRGKYCALGEQQCMRSGWVTKHAEHGVHRPKYERR